MKRFITYSLFISVLVLGCFACWNENGNKQEDEQPEGSNFIADNDSMSVQHSLEKVHLNNIYQVKKSRKEATDEARKKGKELYDAALFACSEDKLEDGANMLIESILYYPDGVAYFELGNIYQELKNYESAIDAYKMGKQLEYIPICDLYYSMACAFAMDDSDFDGKRRAINYLRLAVNDGYANKAFFLKDKRLSNIRYTYDYNKMYLQTFAKEEKYLAQEKFELFSSLFPEIEFPFEIEVDDLYKHLNQEKRLYDPLISFVSQKATYMPEEYFSYTAILKKTSTYMAVIYAEYPAQQEEDMYVHYTLATYSPTGQPIAKIRFADSKNPEKYLSGSINENMTIKINQYQNVWKKSPKKYGYTNNSIEYSEFQFSKTYRIDKRGKILKVKKK